MFADHQPGSQNSPHRISAGGCSRGHCRGDDVASPRTLFVYLSRLARTMDDDVFWTFISVQGHHNWFHGSAESSERVAKLQQLAGLDLFRVPHCDSQELRDPVVEKEPRTCGPKQTS
jgi:hypothetical protein